MVLVKKWPFCHLFSLSNISKENVCCDILERKIAFQPIKTRSSKSRKIEILSKGLTHGFGQKTAIFPCISFFCNIGQENVIDNIPEQKNAFLPRKKTRSKSRKIEIFPKGLTHSLGEKMAIFPCLFFRQHRLGKCVLQYSRTEKRLSSPQKNNVQKVEKLRFFQRG